LRIIEFVELKKEEKMKEKPIFKKHVCAQVSWGPFINYDFQGPDESVITFPLAKISFFKKYLVLNIPLFKKYILQYKEIESIEKDKLMIRINHSNKKIPLYVWIWDSLLTGGSFKKIKETIKKNKLKIKVEY
jgi:hypothetical protein